jgi:hypothetical protein
VPWPPEEIDRLAGENETLAAQLDDCTEMLEARERR